MKKVLVTGASGFVGAHIVRQLLQKGCSVWITSRQGTDLWRLQESLKDLQICELDLRHEEGVERAIGKIKPEVIIHSAAYGIPAESQDPHELMTTNIQSTFYLIKAAAKFDVARFIHTGSCSEFNSDGGLISETKPPNPADFYGVTKAASTLLALQQAAVLKLNLIVLRLFNLYGAQESPKRLIPAMLLACHKKEPLALTTGEQIRDYTLVDDVASLYAELVCLPEFPLNDIFHIGTGKGYSIRAIGEIVEKVTGERGLFLWGKKQPHRQNEMQSLVADISKAEKILNWSPRTTLVEGIERMRRVYG